MQTGIQFNVSWTFQRFAPTLAPPMVMDLIMIPIFGPESYSCFCVSELLAEGTQRPPAKVFLRAARDIEPLEELTQFYCDSAMD